jgi:protein TonB
MKTIRKTIFQSAAITILCIALSFIISCKSGTHSEDMTDTTAAMDMNTMKTDTMVLDTMKVDTMKAGNTQSMSKLPKKKGTAIVQEPIAEVTEVVKEDENKVYAHAEVNPIFPGGQAVLDEYIKDNIKYPASAMENGIEGKVVIQFIVNENGGISGTTVLTKPLGYGIEEEAIRVVNNMPVWIPGKVNGKKVKTYRQLPIVFALE